MYKNDEDSKYPYSLFIEESPGSFIFLKTAEKWPGPGKNIFCKFEGVVGAKAVPKGDPVDECAIFSIRRYGKRLTVILDRARNKRSWFIFIEKEYKSHPGTFYTQVFWITQSSSVAERRGAYIPRAKSSGYRIIIDSNERYPYQFGEIETKRERLPSGDYGLSIGDTVVAVVERKTRENFLHEIAHLDVFRAKLQEMAKVPYRAVVLEALYAEFVSPKNKFNSGAFIARVIADLCAEFPNIPFLFFKGRKSANQWVFYYFQAVYNRRSAKGT
jgi:hypothetical protein